MRKSDREVKSFDEIVKILAACDTVRVGLNSPDYPYIVPLSFGYETIDGKIIVYVHGAKEGYKHELIARDPRVCVEADIFHRYAETGRSVTACYDSVIGFGTIEKTEGADAAHGIELLMEHCGFPNFDGESCTRLGITLVYKITLERVTGKRRTV